MRNRGDILDTLFLSNKLPQELFSENFEREKRKRRERGICKLHREKKDCILLVCFR